MTWEPKRYTLEMDTDHLTRRPSRTHLWRALCSILSKNHHTPSHTSSYILNHTLYTYG